MTKNVTVTDANGTYVGTTYPKRARGLVKNGRALFVDDCTIRLSAKTEPSEDIKNQSEVNQMNYIYFNPREWYLEKTQYNTQRQNNSFWMQNSTWRTGTERCFINDFDGGLVESLMFGGWNDSLVRMISDSYELLPDTENCFVFWLNGGENDKNSEICQLQISFFDNPADCYTYKLNRNYIKPLLHRQGWELYSIPFITPAVGAASVVTRFSFVAGNAPMAVKPARELSFYKDWADEPDEYAKWRPQRHNLVFEDGWPTISMYGGDTYSTEAIRRRLEREAPKQQKTPNPVNNSTDSWESEEDWCDLEARLDECSMRKEELTGRQEELSEQSHDLQMRYEEQQNSRFIEEHDCAEIEAILSETQEWTSSFPPLLALEAQLSVASDIVSRHSAPICAAEGILNGIEEQLDSVEELCDDREQRLDELDGLICDLEEAAEANEDESQNMD